MLCRWEFVCLFWQRKVLAMNGIAAQRWRELQNILETLRNSLRLYKTSMFSVSQYSQNILFYTPFCMWFLCFERAGSAALSLSKCDAMSSSSGATVNLLNCSLYHLSNGSICRS